MDHGFPKEVTLRDGSSVRLRPVEPGDADALHRMFCALIDDGRGMVQQPEELPSAASMPGRIAKMVGKTDRVQIVAERDGEVVGEVTIRRLGGLGVNHNAVLAMGVHPAAQGIGLGGVLLDAAIEWADTRDVLRIELFVLADNDRGLSLYRSRGFEAKWERERFMRRTDGSWVSDWAMERIQPLRVTLTPLTEANFDAFASLLGRPDFGGCFCAVWTSHDAGWGARCADPERPNLEATRRDLAAGRRPGYLVHLDGELAAWTGSGPKKEFPLLRDRAGARLSDEWGDDAWCIGCLAIAETHRGRGAAARVVEAVLEEARRGGARTVEAYPTNPWDEPRSYRGAQSTYAKLGFQEAAGESVGEADILLMVYGIT